MYRLVTCLTVCFTVAAAYPPKSPEQGGDGPFNHGGPHPPHHGGPQPPHHGGPHPPHHGGPPHFDGPRGNYTYDKIGKLVGFINMMSHECDKEFGKAHEFWMVEAPTPRAIEEYKVLVDFLAENGIDECLPTDSNSTIKNYLKKNAEVVNTCMAGWKLDTTLQDEAKTILEELKALDNKVTAEYENCKPGDECYQQFLESDMKKSIDESVKTIKQTKMIDAKLRADSSSFFAVGEVSLCIMNGTDDLRLDIYRSNAAVNVCAAVYGVPPMH